MKRIDMRYFIVIVAFYAPGLLMLIGLWGLGYPMAEARELVAVLSGAIGSIIAAVIATAVEPKPIWWEFRK